MRKWTLLTMLQFLSWGCIAQSGSWIGKWQLDSVSVGSGWVTQMAGDTLIFRDQYLLEHKSLWALRPFDQPHADRWYRGVHKPITVSKYLLDSSVCRYYASSDSFRTRKCRCKSLEVPKGNPLRYRKKKDLAGRIERKGDLLKLTVLDYCWYYHLVSIPPGE